MPQLDLPALEPQAALMFHLVERYLRPLLPATTVDYLGPWFRAADHVLDATGNGLSAWRSKVRILPPGQPLHPPTMEPTIQGTVTQALFQGKRLSVIYRPRGDRGSKEYVVNPLGLVVRDHVMYLVCTLFEYNNPMQLVLHRLRSAEMLEEPANLLPGFDLDQYIAEGGFGFPIEARKKIKLVAEFTRDAALTFIERPLDLKQVVEDVDAETVRLTATVMDTYELRTWLLGFGKHVLVREPASLVSNL